MSILDNDFYKFTMQQAVVRLFPYARAKYAFINRGKHRFPAGLANVLQRRIENMRSLCLTLQEKDYLRRTCPYLDPVYLDFLEGFRYNPDEVNISQRGPDLQVNIEGLWYRTILWEVPIMSAICESYYELTGQLAMSEAHVHERTASKIKQYGSLGIRIAEFGTRRRFSYAVHDVVVRSLSEAESGTFIGTSNVHMAMKFGSRPIGTHAHEWFMFHAARYGFKMANATALDNWVHVYRGDLGIALSDTYTTAVFLQQFDKMFSKLFDGVRHDSGDPLLFADNVIDHYRRMGIDALTKTIVFSDGLNYDKVQNIVKYCRGRIGMSFGIGTSLTNDVGAEPMNIVIKMTEACPHGEGWTDVVKLSDEPGKYTGNEDAIVIAKATLGIN